MRSTMVLIIGAAAAAALLVGITGLGGSEAKAASCARGTKPAVIGGNFKCLRVGQQCAARYQAAYRKYGFHCVSGRLRKGTGVSVTPPSSSPSPAPAPAPTPAAIDGHYKGVTSQNETFEFDIVNGGYSFRGLKTGQINQGCTPQFHIYGNYFNWPNYSVPVSLAGDFTIDTGVTGAYVGSSPASTHLTIRGHMAGPTGTGSLELNTSFTYSNGVSYTCGSGLQTWTVTKTG